MEYTKKLADQDAESTKQREALLLSLKERYEKEASGILSNVQQHRADVEKLVGVIGSIGVTSGYQKAANQSRTAMWIWQGATVGALGLVIYFAYHAFLPTMQGKFDWETFAARIFLTVTVGVLAAYAGSQADRFFYMEKSNRKLALELAAIDPYIALLPLDEQQKFKLEIGRRSFAQGDTLTAIERSPATTLDLLNSEQFKQLTEVINALAKLKS